MVHQTSFISLHTCPINLSLHLYHSTSVLTLTVLEVALTLQHTDMNTAQAGKGDACGILFMTLLNSRTQNKPML